MNKLQLKAVSVGILSVNCYLVWSSASRQGYIVDPGDDPDRIIAAVKAAKFQPQGVLLTHAHVDHIRGIAGVVQAFPVPVFLHADDKPLYVSPDNALLPWLPAAENLPPIAEDLPTAEGLTMQVIHTPGHTRGGLCYYFPNDGLVLTGDTLFKGSVGRTDLPGGDYDDLAKSIRYSLMTLPLETKVYPGHHAATTIRDEQHTIPM